jgi:hypothetical protein
MRTKSTTSLQQLTKLGGPEAGTASALGIGRDGDGYTLFFGSAVGLYRSVGHGGGTLAGGVVHAGRAEADWERLPNAPLGVVSLAVSPRYELDRTLFAGTNTGVFVSKDGGDTWLAGKTPLAGTIVNTISFSPGYERDGRLLAGTLEDGMLFSVDRGGTWQNRNFGLLDAAVFSVAFSPNFVQDETAFAGTDTAVYHSYNGALAWKMARFPESAAPAMSLAVSPSFEQDHTVLVGTEADGLYRSTDAGATWERLSLPAECIDALLFVAAPAVLAATDAGVFRSEDMGDTWECIFDQPAIISLAAKDEVVLAGPAGQGAWLTTDLENWHQVATLSALPVVGLALPSGFDEDGVALMYGPSEGVWRTVDGGATWVNVSDELPTLAIRAVAMSPTFTDDKVVAAASDSGVLISEDGGQHWNAVTSEPAALVVFSPNGKRLAASLSSGEIRASDDLGKSWRAVPGALDTGGKVAALALGNADQFHLAVIEGIGRTMSIWQGRPGDFEKVHSQAVGENPVAAFWIPTAPSADRPWYAALGNQVLKFSSRRGRTPEPATVFADSGQGESILMLTGVQGPGEPVLLAATGRHVYKSANGQSWTMAHDFGNDRAVNVAVASTYLTDKTLYALLIGGTFARFLVR